jgi:hypothetical protein
VNSADTNVEGTLWMTLPGARATVPIGWLAWTVGAAAAAPFLLGLLGPAGVVIAILTAGWLLALWLPAPPEWRRRYHLDELEVTVIGPGAAVQRLQWSSVLRLTQHRRGLQLESRNQSVTLPRSALRRLDAWRGAFARMVSDLADELWAILDEGEPVRLTPAVDPPLGALAWWALVPGLVACVTAGGLVGVATIIPVVLVERGIAYLRAQAASVTLDRLGLAFGRGSTRKRIAWERTDVVRGPDGLLVRTGGGVQRLLGTGLPSFWALAPVVEMKAQLGSDSDASVRFRVRLEDGGLAVVGEVEPAA